MHREFDVNIEPIWHYNVNSKNTMVVIILISSNPIGLMGVLFGRTNGLKVLLFLTLSLLETHIQMPMKELLL